MKSTGIVRRVDELSDSMIMFIVLNTISIQLIPTTVIAIRSSLRFEQSF